MKATAENSEVLVRFAKYGKWQPLNHHIEDDADLQKSILDAFPDEKFIAMKVGETEAIIKKKSCEN